MQKSFNVNVRLGFKKASDRQFLVLIQQLKHEISLLNMFKVNNKYILKTSLQYYKNYFKGVFIVVRCSCFRYCTTTSKLELNTILNIAHVVLEFCDVENSRQWIRFELRLRTISLISYMRKTLTVYSYHVKYASLAK